MQSLSKDSRFFAQVNPNTVLPSDLDWSEGPSVKNILATVRGLLGADLRLNPHAEALNNEQLIATDLPVYDILSNVLPFASDQTRFYWDRFCRSFASMFVTANYPLESQAAFLIYMFARVIGILGPETQPDAPTMLTTDGSTCEGSWVIPTQSSPVGGQVNRSVRLSVQPIDPRTGKWLRGSQVLKYLGSDSGSLGLVAVKDNYMEWCTELERFLFGEAADDCASEEVPPGTGYFISLSFLPSGVIYLKAYYQPCVAPSLTSEALTKSPIYITSKDFTPLASLLQVCDPSMVGQLSTLVEYVDGLEDRLKPIFHMISVDLMSSQKNRIKVYVQTRAGFSWNDAKRGFTLGGRLDTPQMAHDIERLEVLWNAMFPYARSDIEGGSVEIHGVAPAVHQNGDGEKEHDEHPLSCLVWYYEFTPNAPSLAPKVYFPTNYYGRTDRQVLDAVEAFFTASKVGISGPPDGEHGPGWVAREVEKAYNHRSLDERLGLTTWVTYGHKHSGDELTCYFSPEIWNRGT